MNTLALLQGVRFIDSLFPSGGFAYSSGLEAAVQAGAVTNAEDLDRYGADLLRWGLGGREAVAVALVHVGAETHALSPVVGVDRELDAMKTCRETRLASRQMGKQVLRMAGGEPGSPNLVKLFLTEVETGRMPGHFPVSLGVTLGSFGWTRADAVAAYLYQSAAGLVSAALRLIPMGQREGQRLLDGWLPLIADLSQAATLRTQMNGWAPVQDIYAMQHARLCVRLFRS